VQFRRDVYGIDGQLTVKVKDRLERLRKSGVATARSGAL